MPDSSTRTSVFIETGEAAQPVAVLDPDAPFRILVLGDFSGRSHRGERTALDGRRAQKVDCDNFDEVMAELQPRLSLPQGALRFRELEDFHPDRIYRNLPLFEQLRNLRPATPTASPPPRSGLLDDMISATESRTPRVEDAGDLPAFIQRVSAAHLEERPEASQQAWKAKVEAAVAEQMNAVLHHPGFQGLEAAWRSLWMLILRLGDEEGLEISIFDTTLDELTADARTAAEWLAGAKTQWGLIVANFAFGQGPEDARRLSMLGHAARAAGAPVLAEALPPSGEGGEDWQVLRRSQEARWIGLALPRFLVRLPYGRSTSPMEALDLEEMPESVHAHYLWGNPAFCCALLIGQAFRTHGWNLLPGMHRRVEGLPLHVYRQDGGPVNKPCAEVLLTEAAAEQLLDQGFMPVASLQDQDAVLVVRFCSIAQPASPLAGRWGGN